MQIEALKVFCDVVGYTSFSRAAEENGITQSAASQVIGKLEKHLEVKLIDRSHRPWRLTDEGKVAFERSREVLEAFYRLENDVQKVDQEHRTEIRVATIYSVGLVYMSACQRAFDGLNLQARLHMEYLHPEEVLNRVLSDEIDLGVMAFPPSRRGLSLIPLCEEEVVVAVAPTHALADARGVRMKQLDRMPLVGFDANITMGRKVSQFLHAHDLRFELVSTFDNIEAIKRAVEVSDAATLLPATTLRREVMTGSLVALPIEDATMTRPLTLIHRRGRELTPAMEAFIECMKQETRSDHYELQITNYE
ncbi:MAG: LysR family transcriptional regulator [Planctomycetota bacterium]|jgi:DNA-binding transcriptional LysR family regulator